MYNPRDLYFNMVTVGKKGQIVIPAKLRKELSIASEEQLIVVAAPHQDGFAVLKTQFFVEGQEKFKKLTEQLFEKSESILGTNKKIKKK